MASASRCIAVAWPRMSRASEGGWTSAGGGIPCRGHRIASQDSAWMNPAGDGWWLLGVGGSELWGTRHRWQSEQLRGQASSADTLLTVAPLPARSPPSSPRDRPPPHLPYPLPTPLSPSVPIRLPSALSEGAVGGGRRGGGLPPAASPAGRRHRARCRRRRRLAHAPARLCCPRPSCGSPSFPLPLPPPPPPLPPPHRTPCAPLPSPPGDS